MGTKQYTINYLFQTALLKETCWKKKKKNKKKYGHYIFISHFTLFTTLTTEGLQVMSRHF